MQMHTASGPIIVKEKNCKLSPLEWDEEAVMMLGDYYTVSAKPIICHSSLRQASESVMNVGLLDQTSFKWVGDPQAVVVNGRAHGQCNSTRLAPNQNCSMPCGVHQQLFENPAGDTACESPAPLC